MISHSVSLFLPIIHIPTNVLDRRGNRVLLGITCLNLVLYPAVKAYYVYENKRREKIWDAMSVEVRTVFYSRRSEWLELTMATRNNTSTRTRRLMKEARG